MCALNEMQKPKQYTTVLTAASWYTPHGIAPHDSRILHTYWRTIETSPTDDPRFGDNFVAYEWEQSINEMSIIDIPKIKSWWWDRRQCAQVSSKVPKLQQVINPLKGIRKMT